jgi:hypothetical protein
MTAEVEAAPVIGLRRNGRRLERHHARPLICLGAFYQRQRDQHAASNEQMPHQAPMRANGRSALAPALRPRSPASCRGTQAERKNYAELVTIVQSASGNIAISNNNLAISGIFGVRGGYARAKTVLFVIANTNNIDDVVNTASIG